MSSQKSAVAEAIARHAVAQAAYDAAPAAAASPDDIAGELCKAESDAFDVLVAMPCANDGELIVKLYYLIRRETQLFGSPSESRAEFVSVARAVALHFGESGA